MNSPNILFLMTDQHRWDALGSVDPMVHTPNLDRLASRGIRYDQATCTAPMCVPSRYSMMTGLYPSQCGVRHNTQSCPRDEDLPVPVIPERLREAGYQTAGFGKTHWYLRSWVAGDEVRQPVSTRGFDVRAQARPTDPMLMEPGMLLMQQHAPEGYARLEAETAPDGNGGENISGYMGRTSPVPWYEHREGWLTERALEFLDSGRQPDKPLFLYLSFDFPHAGLVVPTGYEDLYNVDEIPDRPLPPWDSHPQEHVEPDWRAEHWERLTPRERRQTTLRYYALCSFVDDMFGRVLDKLDALGELDNTLVLFTSDHGEMLGDREHRFSKYCLYEGSVRVPLILAGAGIPADRQGTVDERPAELIDVLPTLTETAGAPTPPELPGRSLLAAPHRRGSFAEMHGSGVEEYQQAPAYMWRTKEWKLILYLQGDIRDTASSADGIRGELYDLVADPHEWHNRYDDPACLATREQLTRELLMHLARAWATYPHQPANAQIGADV